MNGWKELWSKRSANIKYWGGGNPEAIYVELKRIDGFDIQGENEPHYSDWLKQYAQIKHELGFNKNDAMYTFESVFEVGCGSGANLYLFEQDGVHCGGLDYSENLINCAGKVLETKDLICDEASNLPTGIKYDAILSNSVFSYFQDESYAQTVLEKMYEKTNHSIGIIDIHDIDKKEEFLSYRKKSIKDYEERYKNLPKLFYSRNFFLDFAVRHCMDIKFAFSDVNNYWNNDFVFNCYMYKQNFSY